MTRISLVLAAALAITACGDVTDPNTGNPDADISSTGDGGTVGYDADQPDADPACGTCSPFASCVNEMCVCDEGYMGNGEVCADINECQTNNGGCDANAVCTNTPGSHTCECTADYIGDGETCTLRWAAVYTDPGLNLGYWHYTTGHGDSVFYADGGEFFRAYNLNTGQVSSHPTSNDFCACGFTATPVSAGMFIYEFGNYGQYFVGQWADRNYPTPRGESGFTFYNGLIYRLGGRISSNEDQRHLHTYNPSTDSWSQTGALADYPWPSDFVGLAGWGGRIFGFCGDTPAGQNKVAVFDIANNVWTVLPDAPVSTYRPHTVVWNNHIFVLADSVVYVFDPATQVWSPNAFSVPTNMDHAKIVLANDQLYVIGDVGSNIQIFRLNAYEF